MQDDGKIINPLQWKNELPEETAQRPWNESQYLPQNVGISKLCEQNAIEEARLVRSMRRDEHKSFLKREEQREKIIRRESHMEIMEKEGAMYILMLDGLGEGIGFRKVFSAKILRMCSLRYQESTKKQWQITLLEERTGKEIISPLYAEEDLNIMTRFKRTILSLYDCSDSARSRSFLWDWLHRKSLSMLKGTEVVEVPSMPGWYLGDKSWHFCSMSDEDTGKYNDYMENFTLHRYEDLEAGDTLGSLLENLKKLYNQEDVGMLLQYRFNALLGRLTGKSCFRTGLSLYGENRRKWRGFICLRW